MKQIPLFKEEDPEPKPKIDAKRLCDFLLPGFQQVGNIGLISDMAELIPHI